MIPAYIWRCSVALLLASLIAAPASLAATPRTRPITIIRPPSRPVTLGAPVALGLRERPLCPHGPCEAMELVRANGSADVTGGTAFWLTPPLLHLLYQLPTVSAASTPPTIAIVEGGDDPTAEADLNTYSQIFGLPGCTSTSTPQCFFEYNGSGIPYTPGSSPATYNNSNEYDVGVATETALDLEAAHATCENCRIMLVETNLNGVTDENQQVDDMAAAVAWAASNGGPSGTGAPVISLSYDWGGSGFSMPSVTAPAYTDFDQPGHVIAVGSGDAGYQATYPTYPSTNPNVVAVGGTRPSVGADGLYGGEVVWNDGVEGGSLLASGSSCNRSYAAPPWQATDPAAAAEGCWATSAAGPVYYRASADVSMDGDPQTGLEVYQSFDPDSPSEIVVGGTSLSTPLIAGVYGLAGGYPSQAPPGGCASGTSCAAYAPYAAQSDPLPALHDITSGDNVADPSSCTSTICEAAPGLDGPTGVGSPLGLGAFGGPALPPVSTGGTSAVNDASAVLTATVDPESQPGTYAYFCWGPSDVLGTQSCTSSQLVAGVAQPFSQTVTGLSPLTTYNYRVLALGPGGLGIGTDETFTTAPPPPPPTCRLVVTSSTVLLKPPRKHRRRKPKPGTLALRLSCDQKARVTLTGTVRELPSHGRKPRRAKAFRVAPIRTSVPAGRTITLAVALPKAALRALGQAGRESATFSLSAISTDGSAVAAAKVARIRGYT